MFFYRQKESHELTLIIAYLTNVIPLFTPIKGLIDNNMRNIFCNIFQNGSKALCYLIMLEFDTRLISLKHDAY